MWASRDIRPSQSRQDRGEWRTENRREEEENREDIEQSRQTKEKERQTVLQRREKRHRKVGSGAKLLNNSTFQTEQHHNRVVITDNNIACYTHEEIIKQQFLYSFSSILGLSLSSFNMVALFLVATFSLTCPSFLSGTVHCQVDTLVLSDCTLSTPNT